MWEEFKGQPVVFLGMSTDKDIEDARFAVSRLKLPYPSLRVTEIFPMYGVETFPTWIVIDRQGLVRGIHVGCRATIQEEMAETIRACLADKTSR